MKCTNEINKIRTDHLWLNMSKDFEHMDLHKGDVVSFDARLKRYWKGYRSYDYDSEMEIDYQLEQPTKIKKEEGLNQHGL